MQVHAKESEDPEAAAIILKLRKDKKPAAPASGGDEEEAGDDSEVSAAAEMAAVEDLFQVLRGRAPNEQETEALHGALKNFLTACGVQFAAGHEYR